MIEKGFVMNKKWSEIARNFSLVAQFGLTLLMPLLMCLLACWFITDRLGVGSWFYIVGFFFGLGGSFMSAYKFFISVTSKADKDTDRKKINFNSHM